MTDRLPAFNNAPLDISGAGDAVLVTSTLAAASGATIWEAGLLGNLAASIQVSRIGNQPVLFAELLDALEQ